MRYTVKPGQVSYGEAIGIILIQNFAPFIPGDVANATTYDFPVRFIRVKGLSVERLFRHDPTLYRGVLDAGRELVAEGVRAVTTDCGFLAMFQRQLARELDVPVLTSSLMQIPLILSMIGEGGSIGIVTANEQSLNREIFEALDLTEAQISRLRVAGLQDSPHFSSAVIREEGVLDSELMERETVGAAVRLRDENPGLSAVLLECSLLPPYGNAVSAAVGLPVFDFITLINYAFSGVVKKKYSGYL